ncbi:hypothetical protein P3T36_006712 [Kitasatospora sp. MAP12-15]|uniref:hypothetical protein n=1 Tax=unclassified Kitasatospora TaxID=2633591 RepID=UPI002473C0FC|nr:hypothetical protein [Kitasatospora sp. MAP12-44]MDH6115302.1 hypothetical protein [Kitasatospora sp. MAP12-44]
MRTMPNDRPADPARCPSAEPRSHSSGRLGPVLPLLRTAAAVLGVLLLVASCSSSKKSSSSTTPTPAASSVPAAPSGSAASSPSATGSAPADVAAATAQVTQNWQSFFSPATPISTKAGLLQNGAQLQPLLQVFAADPRISQISAQVTNVQFSSAGTAVVTYNLLLQGQVVQPNAAGQAVLEDGTWKVSQSTLCGLVALSGNTAASAVPGCSS